jgi:Fur family ferric uptake transcriptional regulator
MEPTMAVTRRTRQKQLIEEEIRKFDTFFTAEEVYERVSRRDPKIGMATVYRYLNDADREDRPHSFFCDRRRVYSFNKDNHCHFECKVCKRVRHFDIDRIDFLNKAVGTGICHFQIDVVGICEDCAAAAERASGE